MSGYRHLSPHVLLACKAFFKEINAVRVPAVLIGGGALGMHGLLRRNTKDLDINVGREVLSSAFKSRLPIVEKKQKQDVPGTWLWREEMRSGNEIRVHATYLSGNLHDVSFDIKVLNYAKPEEKRMLDALVLFSKSKDGICFADLGPILATKVVSVVGRTLSQGGKHDTDEDDFSTCILTMMDRKQKMPEEVAKIFLNPDLLQ
ncbi:hypothetical protein EWM64_g6836 [Hericium alpestre]|uniref:Uncharacterized protein n=1 Tax=Hericium alpestre TaxID=135208 RepID=A0A4Y9ZSC3_9AGAM|nr:hypothetical protein EWM64_g6836 [Hericium alpestre]